MIARSKTTASCLFFLLLSFYIFMSHDSDHTGSRRSSFHMWTMIAGVLLIGGLMAVMVRATIVTWTMVLVMMAFAGKRRRVLAVEGRKITGDVAMHLLKVVIKERSIVAVACATFLSSIAMVWVA
ncbi:uncharacterized protein LOC111913611 [Lactuca sativa]|uniref:uncharacterized protein LOC111913611 n=1 Tax=Lactuca sativa TaxID=4236 RepID=UPI000CD96696|nr:uncharacterized protein LOC111913611 [Lactuca sativa]